jgi:hypothetical protein
MAMCSWVRAHTIGHHLAQRGPKRMAWTDHVSTQRGAVGGGRRLAGQRQGAHVAHPWVMGHRSNKVSDVAMAQQLSDGGGAASTAWGGPRGKVVLRDLQRRKEGW